jgi:ubiquinone/menaquinone biosynthesis C-methylase UbiE
VLLAQLASHFQQAIGFDRSAAQLSAAVQGPNIEYKEADAYSTPLPDKSVDVITVRPTMDPAQARQRACRHTITI